MSARIEPSGAIGTLFGAPPHANIRPFKPSTAGPTVKSAHRQRSSSIGGKPSFKRGTSSSESRTFAAAAAVANNRRAATASFGPGPSPNIKFDPCAVLEHAASPVKVAPSSNSKPRPSLSSADLRNPDLVVEQEPEKMKEEIVRLRHSFIEMYRGKNKLISGSQFRTLVRDTDAPSTCSECEGFKAFIRTLQRELGEMRTENSDLQDKALKLDHHVDISKAAGEHAATLKEEKGRLEVQLSRKDREIARLQQQVHEAKETARQQRSSLGEESEGLKHLRGEIEMERERMAAERARWRKTEERLQAQLGQRQGEMEAVLAQLAKISGMDRGSIQSAGQGLDELEGLLRRTREEVRDWRDAASNKSSELDASRQELLHLKKSMSTIVESQHKACLAETQADFERLQQDKHWLESELERATRQNAELRESIRQEATSVRRGMEALTNQAVRLCVVHPTVEIHVPHQKTMSFKSVIPRERIAEFIQDRVLPRFISMFLQNDTNGAPEAPGGQEGGFDVWIQTMLSELRTVVECNLLRILDDQ